ncbi:MAG TPA: FAD-dependent oxidoreductase [Pseudomonadales bacterium]|nr:FAD-dependent oxidoreductase [Pseudomonadales bacterium]
MSSTVIGCDVLVIGGGAAGIAAATAAGRAGAQTILLERYGFLGGLASAAWVGTICGLYLRDTKSAEATPVSVGFPQEFASRLQSASGSKPLRVDAGLWVLPYQPFDFARVAEAMVSESKNVTVTLHATVADAQAQDRRLHHIRALAWNETVEFRPKTVVDCTGEATAAALAGARVKNGATDQAPSLVFVLENVDSGLAERGLLEVRRELRRAVENGALPAICERLSLVPGAAANGRLGFKLSLFPARPDRPLWQQITDWERQSRALLEPLRKFLADHIPACRNARLHSVAPQLGVRSGRRILGRTRLTDKDVLEVKKSSLGIARGSWPMERWTNSPRPEMTWFTERDYYDIPLDCLRAVELDNVFVAGRCLSAETDAMTSARVIGTALATGWAAGTAAAFQVIGRSMDEAIAAVRRANHQ